MSTDNDTKRSTVVHEQSSEYPSVFRRYIGTLVDLLIVLILFIIVAKSGLISYFFPYGNLLIIPIVLYEPICTSRFCTLGQFVMGYRVRTLLGHERIDVFCAVWRYFIKCGLGAISMITIPARADRRGIHDLVSTTIVIKHKPKNSQ